MSAFAPGMRVIIRDEEWMIKKCDTNSYGYATLQCVGISPLVKDKVAYFLSDLERIEIVDPIKTKLVVDNSPRYIRSRLFLESQWRQMIPTDSDLHIGHHAVMNVLPYQLEPARVSLSSYRTADIPQHLHMPIFPDSLPHGQRPEVFAEDFEKALKIKGMLELYRIECAADTDNVAEVDSSVHEG